MVLLVLLTDSALNCTMFTVFLALGIRQGVCRRETVESSRRVNMAVPNLNTVQDEANYASGMPRQLI